MISKETTISIGLAISLIGGGGFWVARAGDMQDEIAHIKSEQKADRAVMYQIASDIAVIKTILENTRENNKRGK